MQKSTKHDVNDEVNRHFSIFMDSLEMEGLCKDCALISMASLCVINALVEREKEPNATSVVLSDDLVFDYLDKLCTATLDQLHGAKLQTADASELRETYKKKSS